MDDNKLNETPQKSEETSGERYEKVVTEDKFDFPVKLKKDQKLEDFDFHELTADLSNSITDQLYRGYLPILNGEYANRQKAGKDHNIGNDLEVTDIVSEIRSSVGKQVATEVANQITKRIKDELVGQYHANPDGMEAKIDKKIKLIRWIMLPAFAFISLLLFCISAAVIAETLHVGAGTVDAIGVMFSGADQIVMKASMDKVVAGILSVLDLLIIGTLVIMVLIGGYENSIARIGKEHNVPVWFGKLNISELKIKVAASIVVISLIHLLMAFMQIDLKDANFNYMPLMWTTIIHVVFVLSAFGLAYMDTFQEGESHRKTADIV